MKVTSNIFKIGSLAGVMLAMTACSEESIYNLNPDAIPQASDYSIGVTVNPETNQVALNILDKSGNVATGVYPVWYVNNSQRPSTRPTYRDIFLLAGDYPVEMRVGNRNGVSAGVVTGSFHIDQTIFDYSPYIKNLTDNSAKTWVIAGDLQGHLGCGEPGTDGLNWWSANPNDKASEGVYDNILTFGDNGGESTGTYKFDPGEAGTVYVNKDVHNLPGLTVNNPANDADFRVDATVQETTFELVPEGSDLMLVFPANTLWPYIPAEAGYTSPKFKVMGVTRSQIELVQNFDGIAWHYLLKVPSTGDDNTFKGFKYDSEFNMWKNATVTFDHVWFADGSWAEIAGPEVEVSNKSIKLHTPAGMGNDQWQGQVHVNTDIAVSSAETYDFSCFVDIPVDGKVTVKVQMNGDDNTFFIADQVEIPAGGGYVWFSDKPGFDGTVKLALDFGGLQDMDVELSDFVLKKHSDDDGTVLPGEGAEEEMPTFNDADNIFAGFKIVNSSTWFANNDWAELTPQPTINWQEGVGYDFVVPEGMGGSQWQGQVHMWTDIATTAETSYDYCMTIKSDKDLTGVTVKIQKGDGLGNDPDGDDNTFFVVDKVDVYAGEPMVYWFKAKSGVATENVQVCMDYAGSPAGAKISISDIKMQVSK